MKNRSTILALSVAGGLFIFSIIVFVNRSNSPFVWIFNPAIKAIKIAADKGDSEAQNKMGEMYRNGSVVKLNYENAFEYFNKSVKNGNANAKYNLALAYKNGEGTKREWAKYYTILRQLASEGHSASVESINKIGDIIIPGDGTEKCYLGSSQNIFTSTYGICADESPLIPDDQSVYLTQMGFKFSAAYNKGLECHFKDNNVDVICYWFNAIKFGIHDILDYHGVLESGIDPVTVTKNEIENQFGKPDNYDEKKFPKMTIYRMTYFKQGIDFVFFDDTLVNIDIFQPKDPKNGFKTIETPRQKKNREWVTSIIEAQAHKDASPVKDFPNGMPSWFGTYVWHEDADGQQLLKIGADNKCTISYMGENGSGVVQGTGRQNGDKYDIFFIAVKPSNWEKIPNKQKPWIELMILDGTLMTNFPQSDGAKWERFFEKK